MGTCPQMPWGPPHSWLCEAPGPAGGRLSHYLLALWVQLAGLCPTPDPSLFFSVPLEESECIFVPNRASWGWGASQSCQSCPQSWSL